MKPIKALIFDWGDTLMRDFPDYGGAMVTWPRVEVMPGTTESLNELQDRYVCCVASNAGVSDAELMGEALARVGLRTYFHCLFTSKELGAAKPSPAFFQAILARIGAEPEECVMIGNDYGKDIASAKAVGLRTIWLAEAAADRTAQERNGSADTAAALLSTGSVVEKPCMEHLPPDPAHRPDHSGEALHADAVIGSMAQLAEAVRALDTAGA